MSQIVLSDLVLEWPRLGTHVMLSSEPLEKSQGRATSSELRPCCATPHPGRKVKVAAIVARVSSLPSSHLTKLEKNRPPHAPDSFHVILSPES